MGPAKRGKGLIVAGAMTSHRWARADAVHSAHRVAHEPFWVRALLISVALAFFGLFLLMPLAVVFVEALKKGWGAYTAGTTKRCYARSV